MQEENKYMSDKSCEAKILILELPGSGDEQWRGKKPSDYGARYHISGQDPEQKIFYREGPPPIYTISGPVDEILGTEKTKGWSDTGSNSISNNVRTGNDIILKFVKDEREKNPNVSILILMKSHSRNAVACTHIANFAKGLQGVKVEAVFFDPVPGPRHEGEDLETDVSGLTESTLVYSLYTEHPVFFTPQKVTGAKRLILSKKHHEVGYIVGVIFEKKHYVGFSLNALPPGIYIGVDEVITKKSANTPEEPEEIKYLTYKGLETELEPALGHYSQKDRSIIIRELCYHRFDMV